MKICIYVGAFYRCRGSLIRPTAPGAVTTAEYRHFTPRDGSNLAGTPIFPDTLASSDSTCPRAAHPIVWSPRIEVSCSV